MPCTIMRSRSGPIGLSAGWSVKPPAPRIMLPFLIMASCAATIPRWASSLTSVAWSCSALTVVGSVEV